TVGGEPVAVTWCPLCFTAMVFGREVDGQELTFGVSGNLIMNSLVMYDHQTDSLWSQFLGESVQGPMEGERLGLFSSQLTNWGAWVEQHPDTLLLDRRIGEGGFFDGYQTYYATRDAGIVGETNVDDRLPPKELVVGIDHGQQAKAYAFNSLQAERVLNDSYEGTPIVVVLEPESDATAVFTREAEGRTLTFTPEGDLTMRDLETGSLWSSIQGLALEGPLAGTHLEQVPSFAAFWFAWSDFHPDTALYPPA
ncbi:MAG: DUF3179 domain-containing protein, partial [Dehalococcoidia bacterium]